MFSLRSLGITRKFSTSLKIQDSGKFDPKSLEDLLKKIQSIDSEVSSREIRKPNAHKRSFQRSPAKSVTSHKANHKLNLDKKPIIHKNLRNSEPKSLSNIGEEFQNLSNSFIQQQSSESGKVQRFKLSAKSRRQSSQRSSGAARISVNGSQVKRKSSRNSQTEQKSKGSRYVESKNPNLEILSSQYNPEVPTLKNLFISNSNDSITSNTGTSQIIRIYKELQKNPNLDIEEFLKSNTPTVVLDLNQFSNSQLKSNAEVVINALNSNPSISFETKLKLVKPLSGLESVKSLP
ncbi:hypothetical protein WICMUC_004733 [Wickerhamomyces mucosus]|uniref:Uncharacterized protein n=1 Tax=Wickerhamomyces mucosus TaxID=1378264 RepID=A0A9P8PFY5_9ASCO|nr:hypothetical protein WICMUC_004733 [Wickerhamomyces mucosus]